MLNRAETISALRLELHWYKVSVDPKLGNYRVAGQPSACACKCMYH